MGSPCRIVGCADPNCRRNRAWTAWTPTEQHAHQVTVDAAVRGEEGGDG